MKIEDVALIARIEPREEIPESKLPTMLANIVNQKFKRTGFFRPAINWTKPKNDLYNSNVVGI